MKKLTLLLLFSTILPISISSEPITTNLGPIQLITSNGSSGSFAAGEVSIFGTINIGQSSSDIITIQGHGINYPSSGSSFLMINSSGNLVTAGGGSSIFNCGNLVAASVDGQSVTLGIHSQNYLNFANNSGNVTLQAHNFNANLLLSANGNITLSGKDIAPSANANGYSLLSVDRSGNITTTTSNNIFKIGSDNNENNHISIDNENRANGINLNSTAIYLQGQNLSPASGSTNILTIDSNGKLGIVLSAKVHKEEIKSIKLNNSIDSIKPVSYKYKGGGRIEYGFLAEDLMDHEILKHAVIFEPDEVTPMSINYQSVFVAFIADYLETKKELKAIKKKINTKDESIAKLSLKCTELETMISQIINQTNSL